MSLTFGFTSVRDLMAKLERDAGLLERQAVPGDAFFNFVITGYSVIDWVKNDTSLPAFAKAAVQALYADQLLKVCGDLATASKHFTLSSRKPVTGAATSHRGFGVGRYGMGGYGVGKEAIDIHLNDGTTLDALLLVRGVLATWRTFFQAHQI